MNGPISDTLAKIGEELRKSSSMIEESTNLAEALIRIDRHPIESPSDAIELLRFVEILWIGEGKVIFESKPRGVRVLFEDGGKWWNRDLIKGLEGKYFFWRHCWRQSTVAKICGGDPEVKHEFHIIMRADSEGKAE
jgi:hypothetical protein